MTSKSPSKLPVVWAKATLADRTEISVKMFDNLPKGWSRYSDYQRLTWLKSYFSREAGSPVVAVTCTGNRS